MKFAASEIADLQTRLTARWHEAVPAAALPAASLAKEDGRGFLWLVQQNHLCNFQLWHEEDIARRDDLGCEAVYRAKRNIDRANQERNNLLEEMDQAIVAALQPPESGCPCNSETPGMIIDRLSILALKEYHMREEAGRASASPPHREKCAGKLAQIRHQRADLTGCLDELLADVVARRRTFSIYHQFKMYNDPSLNPQLYREQGGASAGTHA
jgi:hypothetical protein